MVNLGFIGTGRMAKKMAGVIQSMIKGGYNNVKLYSVYSRRLSEAEKFGCTFGFEKSNACLEEMLKDSGLDMVYIASPTSEHYSHAMLAIKNNKAIFAEKPFTANSKQAIDLIRMAEKKGILAAEAMWTRYQPLYKTLIELVASSQVGIPVGLTASLCYPVLQKERLLDLSLAGGALLEVGVYALAFVDTVFGNVLDYNIKSIKNKVGIDLYDSMVFRHAKGQVSVVSCGINAMSDGKGIIHCENGYVEIDNINNLRKISVFDNYKKLLYEYRCEDNMTGYEYEIKEVVSTLIKGETECQSVTHDDTIRLLKLCDGLRERIGLRYPFE